MSTTIQYKGNTLATVSNDTKTLKTAGKYMEGDVSITDNSGSGQGNVWQDAEGYLHLDDESEILLQTKNATPSETAQTIKPDAGYYALDKVNVSAISSTYVGSGITRRSSSDLTASGATVSVPSGYYSAAASKSVASMTLPTAAATSATSGYTKKATIGRSTSTQYINIGTGYNSAGGYYEISAVANGTAGTPTATKGTVSNHSISVTPSVTNTTGYITGGTKSGTAVSVSASELVSGTLSITQNGTGIDVTNYASVNVSVPSSGEDVPVFTLDISTNPPTATCNKTFAECEAYISSNNTVAILNAPLASTTFSMVAYNYVASYMIVYAIYDSNGYPIADIGWTIGGGIVYSEPSVLHENLPTAPASTSSGTLQSTISSSTSTRYLNIRRGYYPQDKYYTLSAMPTGTAGTPTATKGTVSNHSVSVTPSVTNTTGYITGSTKTGTAVTVSASELVSGTFTGVSSYGTYDVTNYASVQVPGGSEGTPTATKGTVSNHSVSVTPSVTNVRGYITGSTKTGTAVTVSASELVSGNLAITQNGTGIDVTNYASVNVNVSSGTDMPVYTATYNESSSTMSITCNKTFNEVYSYLWSGESLLASLIWENGMTYPLTMQIDSPTSVYGCFDTDEGIPYAEIIHSNNSITFSYPSWRLQSLSVTQNGTYTPTEGKVYDSVTVNVSGGGGTVKMGALRSDAELVRSWTSDKLFVQDMSGTIPAYTTSNSSIVSSEYLTPIVNVDFTTYDYILVYRCLNTPIYSNGTNMGTGKLIHSLEAGTCELVSLPAAEYVSGYITGKASAVVTQNNKKTVYAGSSSSVNIVTSSTVYGIYNNFNNPAITSPNTANGTIEVRSPSVTMRGSSTYFSSTYWGALTDIRLQYVIELWRSPKASQINGYAVGSQEIHIIDCATGNGTLT